MSVTRRQFAQGLWASLLASDPLQEVAHILEKANSPGWFTPAEITASVLDICYGRERFTKAFGTATTTETRFVISSITKPMIATAVMVLQDRGMLALHDRVTRFLPEFHEGPKNEVTIQHLLTHTAGLPDNLPHAHELVRGKATLEDIFVETCKVPLIFRPGTAFSYSNLGVLVAKEILERIARIPLGEFLKEEVFRPLSLKATTLGVGQTPGPVARNQPRREADANQNYQLGLGTPWGGVYSTAGDLTRFLQYFVNPSGAPLRPETALSMLRNYNEGVTQPWGIGWMLAYSHDAYHHVRPTWRRYGWSSLFGDPERFPAFGVNCSPGTFGHYGVTGTLAWADPQRRISLVLLTTKSARYSRDGVLGPVSDLASRLN